MVGVREYKPDDFRKKSSVEWFELQLAQRPNDTGLLYARGATLAKNGNAENALKTFDKVTSLDPNHIKSWNAKAKILFRTGRFQKTLICFNKLIELDPRDETFWYGRGLTLTKLKGFREAMKCFRHALELNQDYTDARRAKDKVLMIIRSLQESKDIVEASEDAQKEHELDEVLAEFQQHAE